MTYYDELTSAMTWLGSLPGSVFLGQCVRYPGNALFNTLTGVTMDKRIEMGVCEDMQLGAAIGLAYAGKIPVCIFPRIDFLMCAMNQLANHLDHFPERVIIRTAVGSRRPLDPGPQHSTDYVKALRETLSNTRVIDLTHPSMIRKSYLYAVGKMKDRIAEEYGSHWIASIIIERADLYGME